ncbi:unnamed protein product [Kuraishia capsulata CBS 1993]|uniref:Threonine dehydratase n=1 Tax=Kuraishia capsulata CBS 1993 TaxID=1382522 RepID=W6ML07_9ASCO|nr:uncharacterized protein KUCA_T00001437001 [Kuraishia capsulata CBS 1993]CDK25467.1 unnamed protein product [Kuraishia capsulata CBS 1993]
MRAFKRVPLPRFKSTAILERFPDLRKDDILPNGRPDYVKLILTSKVYDAISESPISPAPALSSRLGVDVVLKREDLLPVFSFKLRGAYNMISQLSPERKAQGVIACSAGNHAQGVAFSAKKLGIPATIVMPLATPSIKYNNVARFGAKVVLSGQDFDGAKAKCAEICEREGMTDVPPFEHPYVIAGQGTIAVELLRQISSDKIRAVFCAVGGGGLIAGVGSYLKRLAPHVKVIGVETYDACGMYESLKVGHPVTLDSVGLFADGTAVKTVGSETFTVAQDCVDEIVRVSTDEICAAIKDIFEDTRAILEPSGAVTVAGLKKYLQEHPHENGTYVPVLSGANMNFDRLRFVSERAVLGEGKEAFLCVQIPDVPGTFLKLQKIIHPRSVTEFSYRLDGSNGGVANVYTSFNVNRGKEELNEVCTELKKAGFNALDISDNEMAKSHGRYLVGGSVADADERVFSFEFPERPGALTNFLEGLRSNWNLTLFHYRNQGHDIGKVLAGISVPKEDYEKFDQFLENLHYSYQEETDNDVYKLFLKK